MDSSVRIQFLTDFCFMLSAFSDNKKSCITFKFVGHLGRNRWVEYSDKVWLDYDGSQVPAEWFGWLHYKTDLIPTKDPNRPKYHWMADHEENPSGTPDQYMPYSTTPPKIEAWVPPKRK